MTSLPDRSSKSRAETRLLESAYKGGDPARVFASDEGENDRFALALALLRRGKAEEALDLLETIALSGDNDPVVYEAMARAANKCGEKTVAHLAAARAGAGTGAGFEPSRSSLKRRSPSAPPPPVKSATIMTRAGLTPITHAEFSTGAVGRRATTPPADAEVKRAAAKRFVPKTLAVMGTKASAMFSSIAARRPKTSRWKARLMLSAFALGLAVVTAPLVMGRLDLSSHVSAPLVSAELESAMTGGDLGRLATVLDDDSVDLRPEGLRALGNAVVYRYWDLDPTRRKKVAAWLSNADGDDPFVATVRATMGAPCESLSLVEVLTQPNPDVLAQAPLTHALLANIYARAGDRNGERASIDVALRTTELPPHLAFTVGVHLLNGGLGADARELAKEVRTRSPRSSWSTAFAALLSGRKLNPSTPVAVKAELESFRLRQATHSGNNDATDRALAQLRAWVGHDAYWTLRLADELIAADAIDRARSVTAWPGWPTKNPVAKQTIGIIEAKDGHAELAKKQLLRSWRAGLRDPRAGHTLARLMMDEGRPALPAGEVLWELSGAFPQSEDVALAYAELLVKNGDYAAAEQQLDGHIHAVRRHATKPVKGLAYALLAQAANGRGQAADARRLAQRSLRYDPSRAESLDSLLSD